MANQTTNRQLLETIIDQGIQNTYFFNGRLLTASDFQTEQNANRLHHAQLGQGIGEGIVHGLEVNLVRDGSDGNPPVLGVANGLALNRNGQAVALPIDVSIALARSSQPTPLDAGLFVDGCNPLNVTVPIKGKGAYILIITPASGYQQQVPKREFGEAGKVNGCGSRYAVEGVKFRLVEFQVSTLMALSQATRDAIADLMTKTDTASLSKLRNWLAHLCFGTEELVGFLQDPFKRTSSTFPFPSPFISYGAIDALRAAGTLTDCDVPLALVYWPDTAVRFVDLGSVRRRLIPPTRSVTWSLPLGERRVAEAEAIFFQFEEQVESLFRSSLTNSALASVQAKNFFRYLPAAGILPLRGKAGARGFDVVNFTSGLTLRGREAIVSLPFPDRFYIEGGRLEPLMRDSLSYPPIDPSSHEVIWHYLVRENEQVIDNGTSNAHQPYLVLINGQMPFAGEARFDLSYFGYSNFA